MEYITVILIIVLYTIVAIKKKYPPGLQTKRLFLYNDLFLD